MIAQKAVEVAREVDTVLVGDDTDLFVLLRYYASLESHIIFFKPELKKGSKNPRVWRITAVKGNLVQNDAAILYFCMRYLNVIQHHSSLASEKVLLLKNLSPVSIF